MTAKLFCLFSLLAGIGLLAFIGEPSPAMLRLELLIAMGAALAMGFALASVPRWLRSRLLVGTALVHFGIVAVFVNPSFLISALCIGAGLRLLMTEIAPESVRLNVRRDLVVRPGGDLSKGGDR